MDFILLLKIFFLVPIYQSYKVLYCSLGVAQLRPHQRTAQQAAGYALQVFCPHFILIRRRAEENVSGRSRLTRAWSPTGPGPANTGSRGWTPRSATAAAAGAANRSGGTLSKISELELKFFSPGHSRLS